MMGTAKPMMAPPGNQRDYPPLRPTRQVRRMICAAIFDVDGVLVASPHERAWREALTGFRRFSGLHHGVLPGQRRGQAAAWSVFMRCRAT